MAQYLAEETQMLLEGKNAIVYGSGRGTRGCRGEAGRIEQVKGMIMTLSSSAARERRNRWIWNRTPCRPCTGAALGRLPRLAEAADTAAFIASDHAGAMTGAVST